MRKVCASFKPNRDAKCEKSSPADEGTESVAEVNIQAAGLACIID